MKPKTGSVEPKTGSVEPKTGSVKSKKTDQPLRKSPRKSAQITPAEKTKSKNSDLVKAPQQVYIWFNIIYHTRKK